MVVAGTVQDMADNVECDDPQCACHGDDVEVPPRVVARMDQVLARLRDEGQ